MNPKVDQWIDQHQKELIDAVRESMRIPSVKGEPAPGAPFGKDVKAALDHALALAQRLGFETRDMEGYIGYADCGCGAETLGVMAHLDVVPEGDGWEHPAFGADMDDANIYGRGAMDDKGPAFAALFALAAIKECGIPLKRRVRIMLGCDEESGWGCMDYYKAHEKLPELAFSPDAEYPLVNSEKGICHSHYRRAFASSIRLNAGDRPNVVPGSATAWVPLPLNRILPIAEAYMEQSEYPAALEADGEGTKISVTGLNAHGSLPEQGKNALSAIICLLDKLPLSGEDARIIAGLAEKFKMEYYGQGVGLDKEDVSGRLTLNLGVMHWDDNGISDFAIDIRHPTSLPGEEVQSILSGELSPLGLELYDSHIQAGHYVAPDTELVSKLLKVYEARSGAAAEPLHIGGGTYARAVDNAVAFGCERPGINNAVHMPNEFIGIGQLMEDTKYIADAILALAAE